MTDTSAQIQQLMYSNLVHLCLVVLLLCVKHTIWEQFQLENFLKPSPQKKKSLVRRLCIPNLIPRMLLPLGFPLVPGTIGLGIYCTARLNLTWYSKLYLSDQVLGRLYWSR